MPLSGVSLCRHKDGSLWVDSEFLVPKITLDRCIREGGGRVDDVKV